MNTVRYGSAAACLAVATMLSLPGCFGGKDSKLAQNPGEATLDKDAGTSSVDLGTSGGTQQVSHTAKPGAPGEVHAHFLSADGKEYVDQINYARLKQNLPDRPGASVNSVAFDQFLKTDYSQLGKNPAAQPTSNAASPAWANQNVAKTTPAAGPGVSTVSLSGAQTPAAANPFASQPPAVANVALGPQSPSAPDPWATVAQPQALAIPNKPTTVATVAMATPKAGETAKTSTPLKPNSPLVAKYQSTKQVPKPEEKPPFVGATYEEFTPAPAKAASNPSTFLATRIRIDLEEAKIKLADGRIVEAQQNIQSAKDIAMKMPQIDQTIVREIALTSMEVERRLTPPQQVVKETTIAKSTSTPSAAMMPSVREAFPQKTPQISDYELTNNPSIAKLTGGSTVKITPRTAFIDLSRDSVNDMNSANQPIDQVVSFEKSIAKANQPISLGSANQGGASTSTMLPVDFWHSEPVAKPASEPALSSSIVESTLHTPGSFSNHPMQVPQATEVALAAPVMTPSLPMPVLTAPTVAQVAFEDGQETPPLAIATHSELTAPAAEKTSTLEAKDSRLEIPGWVTYGVIISAIGLLTLAFRRM